MVLSGLSGYYLLYFLCTLLLFVLIRRKLSKATRTIVIYACLAVLLGAVAPFAVKLTGVMYTLILFSLVIFLIALLIMRAKQQMDRQQEEFETLLSDNMLSLPNVPQEEQDKESPVFGRVDKSETTEQQVFGQEAIDQILSEFWQSQKEQKPSDELLPLDDLLTPDVQAQLASSSASEKISDRQDLKLSDGILSDFQTDENTAAIEPIKTTELTETDLATDLPADVSFQAEEDEIVYHFSDDEEETPLFPETGMLTEEVSYLGEEKEQELLDTSFEEQEEWSFQAEEELVPEELPEESPQESPEESAQETVEEWAEDSFGRKQEEHASRLSAEEQILVQKHYEIASDALKQNDYQTALRHLSAALEYPLPIATRYMITRDYVKMLKQMGLYEQAIHMLRSLLAEAANLSSNRHLEMEITHHIKYIESVMRLVRLYQKPNLPWSLIPPVILQEAKQACETRHFQED